MREYTEEELELIESFLDDVEDNVDDSWDATQFVRFVVGVCRVSIADLSTPLTFDEFWEIYGKKGNKKTTKSRFNKLTKTSKRKIAETLPAYIASTPDKMYRKNAEVYLNQEVWFDEIQDIHKQQNTFSIYDVMEDKNGLG